MYIYFFSHKTNHQFIFLDLFFSLVRWYHGYLSKEESSSLVERAPVGTFLVRNRSARVGQFVLVWCSMVCFLTIFYFIFVSFKWNYSWCVFLFN